MKAAGDGVNWRRRQSPHRSQLASDRPGNLLMRGEGIHVTRDISGHQSLSALASRRLRARGNPSIWDNTVSYRSGNSRRKNREAGVDPSEARQSK
jgi:hypothetical protein